MEKKQFKAPSIIVQDIAKLMTGEISVTDRLALQLSEEEKQTLPEKLAGKLTTKVGELSFNNTSRFATTDMDESNTQGYENVYNILIGDVVLVNKKMVNDQLKNVITFVKYNNYLAPFQYDEDLLVYDVLEWELMTSGLIEQVYGIHGIDVNDVVFENHTMVVKLTVTLG